ncbi:TIM barrel protein [Chloroflexota bacterium]
MAGLLFGTAGTPHSARTPSTIDGIKCIAELGLGCMEIEFVRGVKMGQETALLVAEAAEGRGIRLSAHAPYYINMNSREPEKIQASKYRILQTARVASLCHAETIVFHPGFYMGDSAEKTYRVVREGLEEVLNQLHQENNRVWVRPEVTGKGSQFGSIEEVLKLSAEIDGVAPCIDFAHWHARTGEFNSYGEFTSLLQQVKNRLGSSALDNMHIHVAGINYGKKGELNHLNLAESDFRYADFLGALKDCGVRGMVICESPNLEEDALLLQTTYGSL